MQSRWKYLPNPQLPLRCCAPAKDEFKERPFLCRI